MKNPRRRSTLVSSSILTLALIGTPSLAHANDEPVVEVVSEVQSQVETTPEVIETVTAPEAITPEVAAPAPESAPVEKSTQPESAVAPVASIDQPSTDTAPAVKAQRLVVQSEVAPVVEIGRAHV